MPAKTDSENDYRHGPPVISNHQPVMNALRKVQFDEVARALCPGPRVGRTFPFQAKGSKTFTPAWWKSRVLRVATVRSCRSAVAAIRLSLYGIAPPEARSFASNCAQRMPVAASIGRQTRFSTPPQTKARIAFGAARVPSGQCQADFAEDDRIHANSSFVGAEPFQNLQLGEGLVASLNTLASTR